MAEEKSSSASAHATATADKKASENKETKKEAPEKESQEVKGKKEKPVKVPAKFKNIIEEIESLKVADLAELVKILEQKFGVSAAAPVVAAVATGPAGAGASAEVEEKSVFNIELKAVGEKKIEVIKVVRDTLGKGLKEAKDLVDAAASAPQLIKENVKKEEAEDLKKKFEAAGAKVELK